MKPLLPALATAALLVFPLSGHAAGRCKLDVTTVTRGIALNPTLDKLLVSSVEPRQPGYDCKLQGGDEILQINSRAVPGNKARDVQSYWKSLKPDETVTFKVLRNGNILTLTLE